MAWCSCFVCRIGFDACMKADEDLCLAAMWGPPEFFRRGRARRRARRRP
jgi:hypothetical protein